MGESKGIYLAYFRAVKHHVYVTRFSENVFQKFALNLAVTGKALFGRERRRGNHRYFEVCSVKVFARGGGRRGKVVAHKLTAD